MGFLFKSEDVFIRKALLITQTSSEDLRDPPGLNLIKPCIKLVAKRMF